MATDDKEHPHSSKLFADIGRKMAEMKQNKLMCDVNVAGLQHTKNEDHISAHSLVLASSSDTFFRLFIANIGQLSESITRIAVEMNVLRTTVDFIYGKIPETPAGLIELRKGAHILGKFYIYIVNNGKLY